MDEILEADICGLIGEDGFRRLVAAFYRRVPADPVLSRMYAVDELADSQERLGGFLIQRFGGPDTYSQQRGHPRLRMRHARFAIGARARDHWLSLMKAALDEANFETVVREVLESYFLSTANSLMNAADG
jgi:hemoglobin